MSRFDKLKVDGALDAIDKYEADNSADINKSEEVKKEVVEEEERIVRSYSLTKSQLQLLHARKIEEVNLSLSDIVGKAIEEYCK